MGRRDRVELSRRSEGFDIVRPIALASGFVLVAIAHVVVGFVLYRNRVVNKSEIGDGVVFFFPWIAATVAYGALFWSAGYLAAKPRTRWIVAIAVALAAGFISFLAMLTICANEFGT
jgi:hypothetical protein